MTARGKSATSGVRRCGGRWSGTSDQETAIQSPAGGTKITWGGPPVAPKSGTNRLQLELALAADADFEAETDRLLSLGARHAAGAREVGRGRAFMLDPDGNEFTVRRVG